MLIKLIKYEFKATWRKFLPIYGILIVFTIISKLTNGFKGGYQATDVSGSISKLVSELSMFLQVACIIGLIAVTLYVIVERFYKNFFGDEGYLTFTLPISPWRHLTAKLTASVFWTMVSIIIGIVSLLISYYDGSAFNSIYNGYGQILGGTNSIYENIVLSFYIRFGIDIISLAKTIMLAVFAGYICEILMIYLSISVGHLFFKNKKLASFGAYLIFSIVVRVISFITMFLVGFVNEEQWLTVNSLNNGLSIILVVGVGTSVILAIIFWTVLEEIINKKLNLE
ncbi:hypothetical protein ACPWSR_03400 [Alloiococcus sp. CFN-8]|uniref:hypothetical protein n=1 Tax=Alloiococcus sp. CFN-8 TaxID=3416081 RepID=UPI003CF6BAA2